YTALLPFSYSLFPYTTLFRSPDYIFAKDVEGRFILSNIAHARAAGSSAPEDLIGKVATELFPSQVAGKFAQDDVEVLQSGEPLRSEEQRLNSSHLGISYAVFC